MLVAAYERMRRALVEEIERVRPNEADVALARLDERLSGLALRDGEWEREQARLADKVRVLLRAQGIAGTGEEHLDALRRLWPLLGEVEGLAEAAVRAAADDAKGETAYQQRHAAELARAYGLENTPLDEADCLAQLEASERLARRHALALELAQQLRARIVQRVLPETAVYMRALLPELTAGRYRDVKLLAEEGDGAKASLRIQVWDAMAGRYVAKDLFSGGTRDQCSLALRLAFALATLPKELGAVPGFIFLDEPLSSFDAERSHALVEVLTRGTIAREFAQVLLISHGQPFDRERFRYHIRMSGGRIDESDLPGAADFAIPGEKRSGKSVAQ
jgi:DNA repair exonuclease SbcCD ATPase subunit